MKKAAGFLCLVAALSVTTSCVATKQGYVSRGNKQYDAGKYQDAILNYRKAIQRDPNFGEAWYRLGLAAMKSQEPDNARQAYESLLRATQLLPNNVDAKEKLADVCLAIYLTDTSRPKIVYDQLTRLSRELLAANANSYQGLVVKAYLASSDRKPGDAIEFFRQALKINSSDPGVSTSLAQLLIQNGQAADGERILLDLTQKKKTSYGPAYDLLFAYYSANRPAEAEKVWRTKVENNPKSAEFALQLAQYYAGQQKMPEMQAALQRLLDNPKDFPAARLRIGDFFMARRDYPRAIQYYQEGARSTNDPKEKTMYRGKALVALLSEGKTQEALALTGEILKDSPDDKNTLRLRADILMDSGRNEALDSALQTYQLLVKEDPNNATLHVHLGRALRRKGDLGSAARQFRTAIEKQSTSVEGRYELALIALTEGQANDALQLADQILAIRPDYRPGRLLRVESLSASGRAAQARTELAKLEKETPNDRQVQLQMALISFREKKFPEALEQLNALRITGDPRVYLTMSSIYAAQRQFDKAYAVLDDGLKKSGDAYAMHNQMAITAVIANQYDRAFNEFSKVLEMDPRSVITMRRMADLCELRGDQAAALKYYRKAYEAAPNNAASAMALAGALAQAGQSQEAKSIYLNIVKAHPDDPTALNNAAYTLADLGSDLDQALQLAQKALSKEPEQPAYKDTVGYVYLKKGMKDSAVQTFTSLVTKYPKFAAFRYHLGLALYEKGDKAAAKKELQTALENHPSREDERRIKDLLNKI